MSDLRERLERRSEHFELPPDALQRTLDRGTRRRARRRIGTAVVALAVGIGGLAAGLSALPRGRSAAATGPTPSREAVATIPDGVYWTHPITRSTIESTLREAGFSRRQAARYYFGPGLRFDRWIRQGLVVQDGFWFQTAESDTGKREAGWSGSFTVTGPHTVQAKGYGCTITYSFSVSGRTLYLHVIGETGSSAECGPGDLVAQTAIFDPAPFVSAG